MTDSPKNSLNTKVVLAVSEALAMHLVAQRFGIEISMAEDWLRHHRNTVEQTGTKISLPQSPNFDKYRPFVDQLISDKPDIKMGGIAEQLMAEILAPKPLKLSKKNYTTYSSNSNSKSRRDKLNTPK